jgi:hypothetical protein
VPRDVAVLLGAFVGWIERLEIRCSRCDRHGRVPLAKLIEEHGSDLGLPGLAVLLAKDCPKAEAPWGERCWGYFPQLSKVFPGGEG